MALPNTTKYARGHKRRPDKDALMHRQKALHGLMIRALPHVTADSYDCRALGLVPPVKNQSECGSCWDFSGTGVVTSALIAAGICKVDGSLVCSEQYTLDCYPNGGCDGDDNVTVLEQAYSTGLATEPTYPTYQGQAGRCASQQGLPLRKILSWGFCDPNSSQSVTSTQLIKNAMVAFGPIGVGVAAGDDWDGYTSGEFAGSGSTSIDHDVILVGWQPSTLQPGKSAWIMRNSWGTSWGMNGYMLITEGADSIGTEAVWATAVGTPPPAPSPNKPAPFPDITAPGADPLESLGPNALAALIRLLAGKKSSPSVEIPSWLTAILTAICSGAAELDPPWDVLIADLCIYLSTTGVTKKCKGCK